MSRPAGEHPYEPYRQRPTYLPPEYPPPPPPAPPRPPRRSRRRLWYAVALVALLPAWLGFLVWRAADQSYGKDIYAVGPVAEHDRPIDVAGTRWRLTSIAEAPRPTGSLTDPPPRGGTLVRAYLEVTPATTAAAKKIAGCTFAARDARGRVWDTADSSYVEDEDDVPDTCTPPGYSSDHIPAGRTQRVGVTFLVPADAARSLRPMVRPSSGTPYVLFG